MNYQESASSLTNLTFPSYTTDELQSLLQADLTKKNSIFNAMTQLVNKLHQAQILLQQNRGQEALVLIEQLVSEGEGLTRQF